MNRNLKNLTILLALLVLVVGATACKRTKSRLPGVWKRERLSTSNIPLEYWIFEDGKVKISSDPAGVNITGESNYVATSSKIDILDFDNNYNYYNGKWRVIDIDNDILRIANFEHGGMLTREFTKVE